MRLTFSEGPNWLGCTASPDHGGRLSYKNAIFKLKDEGKCPLHYSVGNRFVNVKMFLRATHWGLPFPSCFCICCSISLYSVVFCFISFQAEKRYLISPSAQTAKVSCRLYLWRKHVWYCNKCMPFFSNIIIASELVGLRSRLFMFFLMWRGSD
jgi:hypothetical protein